MSDKKPESFREAVQELKAAIDDVKKEFKKQLKEIGHEIKRWWRR